MLHLLYAVIFLHISVQSSYLYFNHVGLLDPPLPDDQIIANYKTAAHTGIRKVMAKMGISTLHSYKVCSILNSIFRLK